MTKHADRTSSKDTPVRQGGVQDGKHRGKGTTKPLETYDATGLVGLRVIVRDAAVEHVNDEGESAVELPKLRELLASVAITRCLMPVKLQGSEIKAIRRIMGLTLAELAKKMDKKTAVETVSRWENDAQPMGGYAEKILRLLVCEDLCKDAEGIEYKASMIANITVLDPWLSKPDYEVPYLELALVRMKEPSGSIIETWDAKKAA